jgi:hypothetical protein
MTASAEQPGRTPDASAGQDSTAKPTPGGLGTPMTDTLRRAAGVAIEALEERARTSRLLLSDRSLSGLTDPQDVHRSLARDEEAARVLRAAVQT